jgi:hypothetical protein
MTTVTNKRDLIASMIKSIDASLIPFANDYDNVPSYVFTVCTHTLGTDDFSFLANYRDRREILYKLSLYMNDGLNKSIGHFKLSDKQICEDNITTYMFSYKFIPGVPSTSESIILITTNIPDMGKALYALSDGTTNVHGIISHISLIVNVIKPLADNIHVCNIMGRSSYLFKQDLISIICGLHSKFPSLEFEYKKGYDDSNRILYCKSKVLESFVTYVRQYESVKIINNPKLLENIIECYLKSDAHGCTNGEIVFGIIDTLNVMSPEDLNYLKSYLTEHMNNASDSANSFEITNVCTHDSTNHSKIYSFSCAHKSHNISESVLEALPVSVPVSVPMLQSVSQPVTYPTGKKVCNELCIMMILVLTVVLTYSRLLAYNEMSLSHAMSTSQIPCPIRNAHDKIIMDQKSQLLTVEKFTRQLISGVKPAFDDVKIQYYTNSIPGIILYEAPNKNYTINGHNLYNLILANYSSISKSVNEYIKSINKSSDSLRTGVHIMDNANACFRNSEELSCDCIQNGHVCDGFAVIVIIDKV